MRQVIYILLLLCSTICGYAQSNAERVVISRAKELFIATANGDVKKIKSLTTSEFYKEQYPYSDAEVRRLLLSVPQVKRMKLVDHIKNHTTATAFRNRAGDVYNVDLKNEVSGKSYFVQLIDEDGTGNWLVFSYDY